MTKNSKNNKELEIVYEPVSKLKPSNYNPRTISEKDLKALVKNMNKYGTLEILVANQRTGNIISGHQRLKAAILLGMKKLPVIWIDVSKRDEKMINLAMNKISGEWDAPMLKDILEEIDNGEGDMDMTGFDDVEIEMLMTESYQDEIEEDEVPEPPENPITKTGDLWLLDEHKVLCGDCTKEEDVKVLMGKEKADMVFTDPPYNVGKDYGDRTDDQKSMSEYKKWSEKWFNTTRKFCEDIVFTPGAVNLWLWYEIRRPKWLCIWIKRNQQSRNGAQGWNAYEPILVYGKVKINYDIWDELVNSNEKLDHPVPKTLVAWHKILSDIVKDRKVIYEPFLGSGTTLIAAEQLNRRCFGIEIEPRYIDVTIKRWENLTGKKAKLLK